MRAIRLADTTIETRASLATGRFFEQITQRSFTSFHAALDYSYAGGDGTFVTSLSTKPGGYFTLHLHAIRDLPELSGAGPVTLTLRLEREGRPNVAVTRDIDGADLVLVETLVTLGGHQVRGVSIAAAPFHFSVGVPPDPVRLEGLVLYDHDLEAPAAGVTVSAAPAAPVVTGSDGRFTIPALPVVPSLPLTFDDSGTVTDIVVRPAYGWHAMSVTFSVPTP
jgi:hypothetical protein